MLWIDGRAAGIELPDNLKTRPQVRLNFDYGFEAADIRILPDRIEANLSFGKSRSHCIVPMTALYMMISSPTDTGCLFPDSIPKEMLELLMAPTSRVDDGKFHQDNNSTSISSGASPNQLAILTPLSDIEPMPLSDTAPIPQNTPALRRSGHLRVVK
jgi:hypothetical protein